MSARLWFCAALLGLLSMDGLGATPAVRGGVRHSAALKADGTVRTWGYNGYGQLGDGTLTDRSTPVQVAGLTGVAVISAGGFQTVALKTDGSVWTWGYNNHGQLGDGTTTDRSTPVQVGGLGSVVAIAAGYSHTVALKADGSVWTWGENTYGALGDGTTTDRFSPIAVGGLTGVVAISAWGYHTVALKSDGSVWAWGNNFYGQLGDGTNADRSIPVRVLSLSGVTAISGGLTHTAALKSDGSAWSWGNNDFRQLGDGTTTRRSTPVPVIGLGSAVALSAGGFHTLALKADGSVWTWGDNTFAELGDGTTALRTGVVQVGALANVTMVSAGVVHSVTLKGEGTVWTWGDNYYGQLGNGTTATRSRPVIVLREGGAGALQTNDWYLDLNPGAAKNIPAASVPAFLLIVSGSVTSAVANVNATVRFRAQDVGNPIRIFAYAPAALAKSASVSKDGPTCVLAQLTSNGLQQVSASSLAPYVNNVTSAQQQAVTVLSNVSATQVAGATFCVGTAATSAQAVDPANSVCAATVPDPANPVCTAPDASAIATSYEGLWLKGDESGWGVNVTHQGTTLFATWFTYDTDGSGMWLVASSLTQTSAGNFSGALYRTVGPAFSANPFNSISFPANYTTVGTLTFSFTDANTGTMSYTVNGVTQSKAITRFIYASGGTNCTLGGTQGASPNYQDLWLRSAAGTTEAGWGINITHQGDILFATWFTYLAGSGSTNKGMWIVMSNGAKTSPGVYTGALQTTTGPAFSATPFNPNNVARTTVGTGTFTFTDANNGTFNYTVNGVSQSKPIARFIYASPATVCQ